MQDTSPKTIQTTEITAIICDCCGKRIEIRDNKLTDDVLFINKTWDYGELKDKNHQLELCQSCYLKIADHFCLHIREGAVKTVIIS